MPILDGTLGATLIGIVIGSMYAFSLPICVIRILNMVKDLRSFPPPIVFLYGWQMQRQGRFLLKSVRQYLFIIHFLDIMIYFNAPFQIAVLM